MACREREMGDEKSHLAYTEAMKKNLILAIFMALVFISCKGSGTETIIDTDRIDISRSSVNDRYRISSNSIITIDGLETGNLYAVFPEGTGSRARTSASLIPTNGGTFLSVATSDEMQLTGSDIGLEHGSFRITELEADGSSTVIDETTDTPLFTADNGTRIYEKNYEVSPSSISGANPEEMTLLALLNGSGTLSSDYGIITPDGRKERAKQLLDLSDEESVRIYSQLHIQESVKPLSYAIKLVSPTDIRENTPFTLSAPAVYRIKASSEELVLEIEMDSDDFRDYSIANTVPDGRYAKTGLRKPYIFPMGIKDGKLLIYIGTATEDVIFNYISGSGNAVLRPITAEERNAISSYSLSSGASFEIRIPAGEEDMIIPFFLNGSMTGATVRLDGDTDPSVSVTVVAGDTSGIGYAERSLRNGMDSAVFKDYHALEYGYIKVRGARDESTVRLSFSR